MDIEDAPCPAAGKLPAEDAHKARQHDHVNGVRLQGGLNGGFKGLLTAQRLPGTDRGGDAGLFGPLQGVGAGAAGQHQRDFAAVDDPGSLGIWLNTTKLISTALSISSSEMSMAIMFFRVIKP